MLKIVLYQTSTLDFEGKTHNFLQTIPGNLEIYTKTRECSSKRVLLSQTNQRQLSALTQSTFIWTPITPRKTKHNTY